VPAQADSGYRHEAWSFGAEPIDRLLPGGGLDPHALHEIKPVEHADRSAAFHLALALAVRRHAVCRRPILWVQPARDARETGRLYGPGLFRLGLDPAAVILVETANQHDAAWAIEEGLKARALSLVTGIVGGLSVTAQRRLALACADHETPCLLVTPPQTPGAGAAWTRWRVARKRGRTGAVPAIAARARAFDGDGGECLSVRLERCRAAVSGRLPEGYRIELEWSDEAFCFRVPPAVADRTPETRSAGQRAG
jgi:protein ImuA